MADLSNMTNEELWQLFPIILEEHNPLWEKRFEETKKRILGIIPAGSISRINHIGSTYVPGLVAKPTIDILVELSQGTDTDEIKSRMEAEGFGCLLVPSNPPPHMMFLMGYTPEGFKGQVYHVHFRYRGDWDELYFRDFLFDNKETADEYAELKKILALKFRNHRDNYTGAKGDFVKAVTMKAREAYGNRYT